jgi:hypothetical protein
MIASIHSAAVQFAGNDLVEQHILVSDDVVYVPDAVPGNFRDLVHRRAVISLVGERLEGDVQNLAPLPVAFGRFSDFTFFHGSSIE